ncbi:M20 metallopeptidase family protein [Anaerosinus massiliensis]|uniref:M20 metallopeptidase family protein n=1 Tax=Massilibacillus massiliensis TaxID=1806837 RepID=UPI0018FEAB73|nr:amidohydrolase [Massilibacillus massiliensis]
MTDLYKLAQKHHSFAVKLRRYFHMHPEISAHEYNTQKKIIEELTKLGLTPEVKANTGVIAELKGAFPGKTIAIRADIDALPIVDTCNTEYQSQNHGACHACGHDGHMAILFGTIKMLVDLQAELAGTYRFIFQPNEEEFPSGAKAMIQADALKNVDAIIGAHIWQPIPLGTIGISYGNLMAAPDKFKITIKGKGGHGSMPHQTVDPILITAQIVTALNTIVSRTIDPLDLAVVSVGAIHAGNVFNIIPETATIEGTVRTFRPEVRKIVFSRIEEITQGICLANQASYDLETLLGHPAVVNHEPYAKMIESSVAACGNDLKAEIIPPVMCGEDFSYYLQEVPGAFFFIGTGTDKMQYPHHHSKFDMDESCLLHGMEVMARSALTLAAH